MDITKTTIQYQLVNEQGRSLCLEQNSSWSCSDVLGRTFGGIGIGFAGGLGVLAAYPNLQIKPGAIPLSVIEIVMAVYAAIAAMQVAGGIDYLVSLAEPRMLRRHAKYITFLAPLVTWFMTILAGTGHTAFFHAAGNH
ncbi:anaerobic C4-dicarboxylate transporter family protein [Shigella flexneri]